MSRAQHSYSQKKGRQYQKNGVDAWEKIRSLPADILDKILTISDPEWIEFFQTIFRYRDGYTKYFTFSRDSMGIRQLIFQDSYERIDSKLLANIRIHEVLRGPTTIHLSENYITHFTELRHYFMSITNNCFLQERPSLNSDSPYNIHFYKGMHVFSLDLWLIQMFEIRIWRFIQKSQQALQGDAISEQQERILLDFWNSYIPDNLRIKIITDYFVMAKVSLEVRQCLLSYINENFFKLECIYNLPYSFYFNPSFLSQLQLLLGYIERLRKAMYSYLYTHEQAYSISPEKIYTNLISGSMNMEELTSRVPNQTHSKSGISLIPSENPSLFEQLGEDILLFTEWCENHCAWRRKAYLVVVNEITRLIHKAFSQAQIELYGSSRTGLMIPSSDVDIVIVDNVDILDKVATLLSDIAWIKEVKHIHGSVQVVKVYIDQTVITNTTMIPTDEKNELVCDITQISTSHTGIITAMLIRNKLNRFWELTPIILFLKELLYENQLNSSYEGGMNSVAAVIVVMGYFQDYQNRVNVSENNVNISYKAKKRELGELIIGLLFYLGYEFNYLKTGISADIGYFNREELCRMNPTYCMYETDAIVVLDPMNVKNNLGKSCFNVYQIKSLFRKSYQKLIENIDKKSIHPLLDLLKVTAQCVSFQEHFTSV